MTIFDIPIQALIIFSGPIAIIIVFFSLELFDELTKLLI